MLLDKFFRVEQFNDNDRIIVRFKLDNKNIVALVDTGASVNYFCTSLDLPKNKKDFVSVSGFEKNRGKVIWGVKKFKTNLAIEFENFYAIKLEHLGVNCVMGMPFLIANNCTIDCGNIKSLEIVKKQLELITL